MVYIVNKTKVKVDILRGKYLLAPLGWEEAPDEIVTDPNVIYALDRDWIKISKTKPKSDPKGVPPAIVEYFDPSSPMTALELSQLLRKQDDRLAKAPATEEDPLEDKTVAIHAKPLESNQISVKEVRAASQKARGEKKNTDTTPPVDEEAAKLGSFS
jgi:hypothetical protein